MRKPVSLLLLLLLTPLLAACSYGPEVDRSGVRAAVLTADQRAVAVAYQVLRYRPAQGVAAFPDGGVPRYLDDRIVIAMVPAAGGAPRFLQRLGNAGVSGSSSVGLRSQSADPGRILVLASEQHSTSSPSRLRLWRLHIADGQVSAYPDIAAELAAQGRRFGAKEFGDVRVVASDGTLLIGAEGPDGDELWLRSADGAYREIDGLKHFYGVLGEELYYWSGDEARVTNWRTGAVRVIARYDPAVRRTSTLIAHDPTVRAIEAPAPQPAAVSWRGDALVVTAADGATREIGLDVDRLRR